MAAVHGRHRSTTDVLPGLSLEHAVPCDYSAMAAWMAVKGRKHFSNWTNCCSQKYFFPAHIQLPVWGGQDSPQFLRRIGMSYGAMVTKRGPLARCALQMFCWSVLKLGKLNTKICIFLFCYKSPEIAWFVQRMSCRRTGTGSHSLVHHKPHYTSPCRISSYISHFLLLEESDIY